MRSPFSIFRKYQKIAMVIVLLLIMVTFTLGDALTRMGGELPLVLVVGMSAMLGAVVGALLGVQTGKPKEYAMAGVVVGAVVSLVSTFAIGPTAIVQTNAGDITNKQLDDLITRRQIANRFVTDAFNRTSPMPHPLLQQRWNQMLRNMQFSFGLDQESLARDVVLGYLLEKEADNMGIEVSDEAVNDYIKAISSQNQLSKTEFKEIRQRLGISETQLYDALRGELRARMAFRTALPRIYSTPVEYWQVFKQMNYRQRLDVAAIPLENFVDDVADPEPDVLAGFFEQYKAIAPNPASPDAPAFLQPRKVRLAYLEADYLEFEKQVVEATDEEVEKYYHDNKEMFRNNPFPESSSAGETEGMDNPLDPLFTPEEGPALKPDASGLGEDQPDAIPTDEKETSPPSAPKTKGAAPKKEEGNSPTEEPKSPEESEKGAGLDPVNPAEGELLALFDPADEKSAAAPEETSAETASSENNEEAAGEDGPVAAPKPVESEREPLPEFRPLDDDLKEVIRGDLLRSTATSLMKEKLTEALDKIYRLRDRFLDKDAQGNPGISPEEISGQVRQIAEDLQLKYVETEFLSFEQLGDADAHPIGMATDPDDSGIDLSQVRPVRLRMFQSQVKIFYDPFTAQNQFTSNRFVVWKIDDQDAHVPTFDEPGVEAQVLAAWKNQEARPKAETRAEELAELIRTKKKSMAEALAGQSVNGKEDGVPISTQLTETFSWMRESSAPQTDFFNRPPPEITEISAIKNSGAENNEFMRIVFEQMKEGEIRVIPSFDRSVYYIVQVNERYPGTPVEETALKQAFLRDDIFSQTSAETPYSYSARAEQQTILQRWVNELSIKYAVQWSDLAQSESRR